LFRPVQTAVLLICLAACADRPECEVSGDCPEGQACLSGTCKSFGGHGVGGEDSGGRVRPEEDAAPPPPAYQDVGQPARDTRPPPVRDTGPPVVPDVAVDAGPPDAVTDAAPDAVTDSATDAVTDSASDAATDAVTDAATDAVTDAVTDAATDAVTDAASDAAEAGEGDADAADAAPTCDLTCDADADDIVWSLSCEGGDRRNECMMPERDEEGRVVRHTCRVTYVESGRTYRVEMTFWYQGEERHGSLTVVGVDACLF